jgi:transposase
MSGKRYSEEFKIEAIKQITERNYPIGQVSKRLGVTTKGLYAWIKRYSDGPSQHSQITDQLNNRPRKTLMFETPKQVLQKSVALTG